MKVTKEQIIKDFKEVLIDYIHKTGSNIISRDYYRNTSKYGNCFEKFFTFSALKNTYSVDLPQKNITKKIVVLSSILPNTKIDHDFISAMIRYCNINNAQLILTPIKGVRNEVIFDDDTLRKYSQYFCTEATFNDNLKLFNVGLSANNKNPIKSIKELGHKNFSIICASTKQTMEIIPSINSSKTHLIYTSGTCSNVQYNRNITGSINATNNKKGGLIIEIENNKIFHIRNIEWINNYFVDLNKAYYKDKVKNINAEAIIAGDMHISGDEDPKALKLLKNELLFLNCKKLIIHDLCSHNTINHHENDNWISALKINRKFKNLEQEHNYTANVLNNFYKDIKNLEYIVVKSNHDRWLDKYLTNRKIWMNDNNNVEYAYNLAGKLIVNKDPFAETIKNKLNKNIKINFLKLCDSYKIAGIELALHGDIGNNGSKGTLRSIELSTEKCVIGHSHSPKIGFYGMQVGTNTKLNIGYNVGGSSWHNGNVSIYKDGHRQMLLGVNYKISKYFMKNNI